MEVLQCWAGTLGVELPPGQDSHHPMKQQELTHQQLGRKMIRLNLMLHLRHNVLVGATLVLLHKRL